MQVLALLLSLLLLLSTANIAISYKILVYSNLFGHSHIKFLATVADTLTDAGHDVTMLMPVIDVNQKNRTALKTTKKQIFVDADEKVIEEYAETNKFLTNLWVSDTLNPVKMWWNSGSLATLFGLQCEKVMRSTQLLEQLKAENFDLAITEPFDLCAYEIFEHIQIKSHVSVLASTRMDHVSNILGQPIAPSYVPTCQSASSDRMDMWERLMNYLLSLSGSYVFNEIGDVEFEKSREILGVRRSWRNILPETSFLFTNQIPLLDFPAPTFDKIIPIGGISVNTDKKNMKLSHKWDTIMSMRKKNVLISFGSNIKSSDMPDEFKQSLLSLFRSMPDTTFIWKYENLDEKLACGILNVNRGEWLPQNEILADPRLNAFITHGGLASITELAMMGKPAVVVPIFADQTRNAEMLKRHGGAEVLQKSEFKNADILDSTLRRVINNPKYRQNAEKLAEMLNNQPRDPKELLVKHVEFAARFGQLPSMDPYGRQQTIVEYYLLDVIGIALIITCVSIFVVFKLTCIVCCRRSKVKFE